MLFTFPSRYLFAIGLSVVFSLSGWSPIIQPEFLVLRHTQVPPRLRSAFRLRGSHLLRLRFPADSAMRFLNRFSDGPITPRPLCNDPGLGSSPFARHYWGNRVYFLFLRVLRCFSSPRWPPALRDTGIASGELPHSDIRGSKGICPSPRLFAAYHVLRRLREPQASPVRPFLLSCIFRLYDLATSGSLDSRYF